MFFKKLSAADDRYREIEQMLTLPEVISNNKEYQKLIKEYNKLEEIVLKYREYLNAANEVVVAAYLNDQIGFLEMSNVIEQVMSRMAFISQPTYEDYVACDREARILTSEFLL